MLKKTTQPITRTSIIQSIQDVIVQIQDLINYSRSNYSEAVYNQLYSSAEALMNTETDDMYIDQLIGHLEYTITTRDAIANHIQTYQHELNASYAKMLRSVQAYTPTGFSSGVNETAEEPLPVANVPEVPAEKQETVNQSVTEQTELAVGDKPARTRNKRT